MSNVARQVRAHSGGDALTNGEGAEDVSAALPRNCAPDAIDPISQQVVRFSHFGGTGRRMDAILAEFDLLRRKEEAQVHMRGATPGQFLQVFVYKTRHSLDWVSH